MNLGKSHLGFNMLVSTEEKRLTGPGKPSDGNVDLAILLAQQRTQGRLHCRSDQALVQGSAWSHCRPLSSLYLPGESASQGRLLEAVS